MLIIKKNYSSTPVNITTTHFGAADYPVYSQRVNAAVPLAATGGTILLHITGQEWRDYYHDYLPINTYSSVTYGQTTGGTAISPPVLYPTLDAFPSNYSSQTFNMIFTDPQSISSSTKIYPNDSAPFLVPGGSIYSPNSNFRFTLQTDGNLVLYRKNPNLTETAIWASYTQGQPSAGVYLQTDGNMVIYNSSHVGIWASFIYNNPGGLNTVSNAYYALQNDGNLVFYWPMYYYPWGREPGWVIAGATDTAGGGSVSSHFTNFNHPLNPYPAFQGSGSNFQNVR